MSTIFYGLDDFWHLTLNMPKRPLLNKFFFYIFVGIFRSKEEFWAIQRRFTTSVSLWILITNVDQSEARIQRVRGLKKVWLTEKFSNEKGTGFNKKIWKKSNTEKKRPKNHLRRECARRVIWCVRLYQSARRTFFSTPKTLIQVPNLYPLKFFAQLCPSRFLSYDIIWSLGRILKPNLTTPRHAAIHKLSLYVKSAKKIRFWKK